MYYLWRNLASAHHLDFSCFGDGKGREQHKSAAKKMTQNQGPLLILITKIVDHPTTASRRKKLQQRIKDKEEGPILT